MANKRLRASIEAIKYQVNSPLNKDLAALFGALKQEENPAEQFSRYKGKIEQAILRNSGINVAAILIPIPQVDFAIITPPVDRNHPLISKPFVGTIRKDIQVSNLTDKNGIIKGWINKDTARVSGDFSKIQAKLILTDGLLKADFTPQELAAGVLHELGHVFSYFEFLGTTITANLILAHATKQLTNNDDVKRAYLVVEDSAKALGVVIEDKESLAKSDVTTIHNVLLREVVDKRYSALHSSNYDLTGWEMSADSFATRHGAGREIITMLQKIGFFKKANTYFRNVESILLLNSLIVNLSIFGVMAYPFIALFNATFIKDPNVNVYDAGTRRVERIKNDLVDVIKSHELSKDITKDILRDIKEIDTLLAGIKDHKTLLMSIWKTIHPVGRRNYRQVVFQQELEKLVNNDLFVQSAKLKTLA